MYKKPIRIGIIGLGYVGLPLALEFGKILPTIGFDINVAKIEKLKSGIDQTLDTSSDDLLAANQLVFTFKLEELKFCNVFIITVPPLIDKNNLPDLIPLLKATEMVGKVIKRGDIVIYESTVFPGTTEEECVPVLEKYSKLIFNSDFFCGFSPGRINPGYIKNKIIKNCKITSGSTPKVADFIHQIYNLILKDGICKVSSIKAAEAVKVIENSNLEINFAFIIELSLIFERMGIDTNEVLNAANAKWNFLVFRPRLADGQCIGIDSCYLTHIVKDLGYIPEIILDGQKVCNNMGFYAARLIIKIMNKRGQKIAGAHVLLMGITVEKNCPYILNSRAIDVYSELMRFGCKVDVFDPLVNAKEVQKEYRIMLIEKLSENYDAIILAVAHDHFMTMNIKNLCNRNGILYDIKGLFHIEIEDGRL